MNPFIQCVPAKKTLVIHKPEVFDYVSSIAAPEPKTTVKKCSICKKHGHDKSNCVIMTRAFRNMAQQHRSGHRKLPLFFFIKKTY